MADNREVFPTLEDGSNLGTPLKARQEGDAAAAQNGSIGFSFKDNSGNVVLPQLTATGKIQVDDDAGNSKRSRAEDATGSTSLVALSGSAITGALNKVYSSIKATVSCRRDTLFQIVHVDDVGVGDTETILGDCIVGSGQYSFEIDLGKAEFDTTGLTGTQEFRIKYQNFNQQSTVRASLSMNESI